ncbi:MAG TPA: AAA family ATPase, partial [Longimicrobiales bacterium]|nr:AAA family ATPase [Longimicrobiales bacterium]
ASVRQALWLLRKALGEDPILEDEGGLRVETDRIAVDLDALELHLAEGRLVDAWRMWEGGPLQGFSIPDAARWNAWAERLRGGWERRFGEALEVRAVAEDGAARVTWLRRALEVRPYRESAHAALVETFIHQHRPDEAEEALHRARTVVDDATPGLFAELEERLRAIRKEAFQDSDDALRFEFVGRAAEFATLAALWRSVRSGRPRNAAVTGPAGIGKTRLTDELLELTRAEGAVVAGVKGVDTERSIELGAVATLVREMLHLPGAAGVSAGSLQVLHGLVPSSAAARAVRLERPGVDALADAFLDLVEAVAHEAPLVLRVEDLHWVDSRSRSLFFRTARQLRDARVLFLCTCRTEEADGSALRVVEELGGRGRMELVELGPLSRVEVAEMLGLMFHFDDPAVADACADRLGEASGGNPLFLLELLRGLRDEGFVEQHVEEDGTPVRFLRLPAELGLPGTVREALERRLADLSEDARHLARTVARAREPASPAELTRGHPGGESAGVAALGELIRRDVVRWTHDERLILAHDSMRARLVVRGGGRRGPTLLGGEGRRPALVVLAAVALAVLVFALARGWEEGTAGEPVGLDGIVFFDERPHLVGYRPAVADEGRLVLDSVVAFSPPPGRAFAGPPFRSRDGWIVPARGNPDPSLAPDAWLLGEGVDPRLVLETPGDDVVRQVLPDGGHLLLQVEDPDTSIFRMNAVRMPLDGGPADTTVLHVDVSGPAVSMDGRYVLAVLPRARDSVVVLHPDGTRRDAVAVPHGRSAGLAWCPPGYEVLGLSERDAAAPMLWSWRPGAGAAPVEV